MTGEPYVPFPSSRSGPFAGSLPTRVAPCASISGNGAPEDSVIGNPGQRYTDLLTGNMYVKVQSTGAKGWQLVGSAGQAGVAVIG